MLQNKSIEYYDIGKYLGSYTIVPGYITFEPIAETTIYEAARASLRIARRHQSHVLLVFKDIKITVPYEMWPDTNTNTVDIVNEYYNRAWEKQK